MFNLLELRVTIDIKLSLYLFLGHFLHSLAANCTLFIALTLLPLFVAARIDNLGLIMLQLNHNQIAHAQLLHVPKQSGIVLSVLGLLLLGLDLAAPRHDLYHVLTLARRGKTTVLLEGYLLLELGLLFGVIVRRLTLAAFSKRIFSIVIVHLSGNSLELSSTSFFLCESWRAWQVVLLIIIVRITIIWIISMIWRRRPTSIIVVGWRRTSSIVIMPWRWPSPIIIIPRPSPIIIIPRWWSSAIIFIARWPPIVLWMPLIIRLILRLPIVRILIRISPVARSILRLALVIDCCVVLLFWANCLHNAFVG